MGRRIAALTRRKERIEKALADVRVELIDAERAEKARRYGEQLEASSVMTEDQIKHMVDRFLDWRLPEKFSPDCGITFEPFGNKGTPHKYKREPSGTNLFDATQADAMVRYMIEGMPAK